MKKIKNFICLLFILVFFNVSMVNANSVIKEDTNKYSLRHTSITKLLSQKYTKKTIDITFLAMGEEVGHNHVYQTKYDENYHYEECIICNSKINVTSHTYTENWTMGDSCSSYNKLNRMCECGYSCQIDNTRPHQISGIVQSGTRYHVLNYCSVCGGGTIEAHYDRYGILGCKTGRTGTCIACGYYVSSVGHDCTVEPDCTSPFSGSWKIEGDYGKCRDCGKVIVSKMTGYVTYNDREITYLIDMYYPWGTYSGITWGPIVYFIPDVGSILSSNVEIISNLLDRFTVKGRMVDGYENTALMVSPHNIACDDGLICTVHLNPRVKPEVTPPNILSISDKDITSADGWATSKEITISGTENYCSTVNITVKDDEGKVYLDNAKTIVSNGQYSYSFIPNIEADENGREITIIVTDSLGNTNTQKYTIYKIDNYTPSFVGSLEYLTPWSKSKNVTFYAQDNGVKNVKIGFNDESDLELGELVDGKYQREYTFVGDVYGQTVTRVYAEDGLGNKNSEYVKIGNLDNTAPTITSLNKNLNIEDTYANLNVIVDANDINLTLGKSGSGVTHYTITTSNNTPEENADIWQESSSFEITENGTYYLWAKDLVGNISNSKELVVDELTSKYKVKYYLMDKDGNYILKEEEFTGKIGEEVTPTVKEYEGYKSPEPQKITINKDGTAFIEYYYELIKGKITVTKTDKNDSTKYLSGATFKIEKLDNEGNIDNEFTPIEKVTGENGNIEFTDLLVGKYKVTEIKAPEGYELSKNSLEVEITNNSTDINVTATDKLKLILPEAGGKMHIYLGVGIILIIISIIISKFKKNVKEQ